jgi:hypothetical protein
MYVFFENDLFDPGIGYKDIVEWLKKSLLLISRPNKQNLVPNFYHMHRWRCTLFDLEFHLSNNFINEICLDVINLIFTIDIYIYYILTDYFILKSLRKAR